MATAWKKTRISLFLVSYGLRVDRDDRTYVTQQLTMGDASATSVFVCVRKILNYGSSSSSR